MRDHYWILRLKTDYTASEYKTVEEEIAKGLVTKWLEFKTRVLFLNIFLQQEERMLFKELQNELNNLDAHIGEFSIDKSFGADDNETRREFKKKFVELASKKIPQIVEKIEVELRIDFGIK